MAADPTSFGTTPPGNESAPRPTAVSPTSPDDAVLLPRHIADACYHLLQAAHALRDNGSNEIFAALSKALDKGAYRVSTPTVAPCGTCHLRVDLGVSHAADCTSDEAMRYRSAPLPQLDPFD